MQIFSKIKRKLRVFAYSDLFVDPNSIIPTEWFGNEYAGFYVAPEILTRDSVIYSFGIGEDMSFDTRLIELYDVTVFGFDPTPKAIRYMENANQLNFKIFKFGIDKEDGFVDFFLPANDKFVSGSIINRWKHKGSEDQCIRVEMKSFQSITQELGHSTIDILKMDIEGSEYEVVPTILQHNVIIKQLLIEFHHRFPGRSGKDTKSIIELLKKSGFVLVATSNTLEEYTFINRNFLPAA